MIVFRYVTFVVVLQGEWESAIRLSIDLITRQSHPATLRGMGKVSDHFKIEPGELGRGRFGTVKKAIQQSTGTLFAVKVINRSKISKTALQNELNILRM